MRRLAPAAATVALVLLVVGCGGGDTTTVIDKTVTVESNGSGDGSGSASSGGSGAGAEEGPAAEEATAQEAAAAAAEASAGQPEDKIEAPTRVVHLQSFRSPSGNIGCAMFEGGARCDIRKRDWSPPARPASCSKMVDYGQGLTVAHDGEASFFCAGDTTLIADGPTLEYGEASELGGTTCMSSRSGITCANHSGHGFFVSSESYRIF